MVYKNPVFISQIDTIKDTYDWYKTEGFVGRMFSLALGLWFIRTLLSFLRLTLLRILMTGIRWKGYGADVFTCFKGVVYKNPALIPHIDTIKDTYDWYKMEGLLS